MRDAKACSTVSTQAHGIRRGLFGIACLCVLAFAAFLGSGAPSATAAESCPNETLRSENHSLALPDCRAYEQVSPAFKDGFQVALVGLSPDGSRAFAESLGLFAGATSSQCAFNNYELTHAASGWTATPLQNAQLTQFGYSDQSTACHANAWGEGGAGLLVLHPISHSVYESDLYRREADGSLVEVGPQLPPSVVPPTPTGSGQLTAGVVNFIGATPDLSHALFALQPLNEEGLESIGLPPGITTDLWTGDTTVPQPTIGSGMVSLYEYVGTGNTEPELVGVSGGPGSSALISQCGIFPGGWVRGNGNLHNAISADGSKVFFTAAGTSQINCGGEEPPVDELFARIDGSHTFAISQPRALSPAPTNESCTTTKCVENTTEAANFRDASFAGASADGSKVFFTSTQQLTDDATQDPEAGDSAFQPGCGPSSGENGCNLYLYDFDNPTGHNLIDVSAGDTSGLGPQVQGVAAVSEDGSHVYFVAKGVLTEAPNEYGNSPIAGEDNLYVYDSGTHGTGFIATLAPADNEAFGPVGAEQWGTSGREPMNVTADGRFLVFTSTADITPDDTSTAPQVFRYDAQTEELVRVSIGDEGFNDNGNINIGRSTASTQFSVEASVSVDRHPAVSEDGQVVVFQSSAGLTPQALDDRCLEGEGTECFEYAMNIYEYSDGHVYLISDGRALQVLASVAVSPSGSDIFFTTNSSLVPADTDTLGDIYDARTDGGFPAPPTPTACAEETCQGAPNLPSSSPSPASASFSGPGNPPARPKCRKGQVKHRGKCVGRKPHKSKKHHSRRRAHNNRRAGR